MPRRDWARLATFLTNSDLVDLASWRRKLHRAPEVSGEERETAVAVVEFAAPGKPNPVRGR